MLLASREGGSQDDIGMTYDLRHANKQFEKSSRSCIQSQGNFL